MLFSGMQGNAQVSQSPSRDRSDSNETERTRNEIKAVRNMVRHGVSSYVLNFVHISIGMYQLTHLEAVRAGFVSIKPLVNASRHP